MARNVKIKVIPREEIDAQRLGMALWLRAQAELEESVTPRQRAGDRPTDKTESQS